MNWKKPDVPLAETAPDLEISESEKFKENGKWFEQVSRYIVNEFYNPPIPKFNADLNDASNFGMLNVVDDVMDNYAHYFGHQYNRTFFDQTRSSVEKSVISKYIPSHKIYQLINHVEGNCSRIIKPFKDSISARSLSRETATRLKKKADRIRAAVRLKDELKSAKYFGLKFAPHSKEHNSIEEAEETIKNFKDEYEIMTADIARGIYHMQYLGQQFLDDGRHGVIAGAVGSYIREDGGKMMHKPILIPNAIWDYRATDDYQTDALHAGFLDFKTPSEIFAQYPTLTIEERNMITEGAQAGDTGASEFRMYHNNHRRGLSWWNTGSNQVAVATIFFLARTDIRYRMKETKFGVKYPVKIDDSKVYDIDGQKIKGSDIPGDFKVWMVHEAHLIGNCILAKHGYYPYQVQTPSLKQMPQLPVKFFMHRFMLGYFRGVVSRLKAYNELRELYKIKIQQKAARDKGVGNVFDETQFGEDESVVKMLDELERQGVSGINRAKNGGQNGGGQDFMTKVDMSLDHEAVRAYMELYRLEGQEMEEIINIPPAAMGQQYNLMGKSVQENTVSYSSLGQASLYEGLQEFWRRKLDYSANLYKLHVLKSKKTEDVMLIGEGGLKLFKFTEDYTNEEMMVFVALNDSVEGESRRLLLSALQAYNQNPEQGHEALLNTLSVMKHNTFEESVQFLERYADKKKQEMEASRQRQYKEQVDANKMQAAAAENARKMEAILQMVEKLSAVNLKGAWDNVNQSGERAGDPNQIITEASQAAAALLQAPTGVDKGQQPQPK